MKILKGRSTECTEQIVRKKINGGSYGNSSIRANWPHEHDGHFWGASFWEISQEDANKAMEQVIDAGVNHIDIAPSYGAGRGAGRPWMPRKRDRFFWR